MVKSKIHYSERKTYVYLIPSVNYVGITANLKQRKKAHSREYDLKGFQVLAECFNRKEAKEIETIFHNLNCYGNKYVKSYSDMALNK